MDERIRLGLQICWIVILVVWFSGAIGTKSSAKKEPLLKRFVLYVLPIIIAFYLLGPGKWFGHTWLRENFVAHTNLVGSIALAIGILGVLLAVWARLTLGRNWSLSVQLKNDHQLVTSGPYSQIRHPIYTGILLIFIGNVLMVGDYRGFFALAIVFFSFWYKLKKEENWMLKNFGEAYRNYYSKTAALFPRIL